MTHHSLPRTLFSVLVISMGLGLIIPYGLLAQEGSSSPRITALKVERFPLNTTDWRSLKGPVRVGEYVGAVGTQAAWLGFETGEGEVWIHPLKVAREISLSFKISC